MLFELSLSLSDSITLRLRGYKKAIVAERERERERDMLRPLHSYSPSSPHSSLHHLQGGLEDGLMFPNSSSKDVINNSPTPPFSKYYLHPSAAQCKKTFLDQSSFCQEFENSTGLSGSIPSNTTPPRKSSVELMNEIATLEIEIMNLECYLLSLYRTAFEQHLPILSDKHGHPSQNKTTESPFVQIMDQSCQVMQPDDVEKGVVVRRDQTSHTHGLAGSDNQSHAATPKVSSTTKLQDQKDAAAAAATYDSGHHRSSLADHLGASCIEFCTTSPDRLSQDIIKCMSSIYCKLANPTSTKPGFSISSTTSSFSSTSTFSPKNLFDNWSPRLCNELDTTRICQLQGLQAESGPFPPVMEVLKICLDDDNFSYAAIMLQKFRSLVKNLEKVDPIKMKREEKLAFWINIHNALVMHAFLAYGTHNCVRSPTILKAAYNIGGHSINAHVIQSSILGIQSHYSAPWLQTLLSPRKKFKAGSSRHVYALEYPEPLVHFALSSGAHSDPVVRFYTAKNVFKDLKLAKEEFVRGSVYIQKETKLFLPKILDYFAKDMSLGVTGFLLQVVNECLSEVQQQAFRRCVNGGGGGGGGRPDKCIHWLPQNSTFRYLIHADLAQRDSNIFMSD